MPFFKAIMLGSIYFGSLYVGGHLTLRALKVK